MVFTVPAAFLTAALLYRLLGIGKKTAILVAIGISTDVRELIAAGPRPILLGAGCWFAVASVSLLVQCFTGVW